MLELILNILLTFPRIYHILLDYDSPSSDSICDNNNNRNSNKHNDYFAGSVLIWSSYMYQGTVFEINSSNSLQVCVF